MKSLTQLAQEKCAKIKGMDKARSAKARDLIRLAYVPNSGVSFEVREHVGKGVQGAHMTFQKVNGDVWRAYFAGGVGGCTCPDAKANRSPMCKHLRACIGIAAIL